MAVFNAVCIREFEERAKLLIVVLIVGFGGFKDWRVPTKEELQTIYKIRNICGIIPKNDWFWSSSVDSDDENSAWYVFFSTGQAGSFSKSSIMYCRCVR